MKKTLNIMLLLAIVVMASCSSDDDEFSYFNQDINSSGNLGNGNENGGDDTPSNYVVNPDVTVYVDKNGETAYIPGDFAVSDDQYEQTIKTGLVVIGPDGSEFVWVPTTETALTRRDFKSYYSGSSFSTYWDDTDLPAYKAMTESVNLYGGFYMGRYEASYASGAKLSDYTPASKPVTQDKPGRIWVQFSPQDATVACENLYSDNPTVQGFFPWGVNWDTTLQWIIDSGSKTWDDIAVNSTSWGNYSDDSFSPNARGNYTGAFEQAKANNIYDMAGNNWEWTQERQGSSNYAMRGGGYNLMGGSCSGGRFPAALRNSLPGNDHHPNVCFRVALYLIPGNEPTDIKQVTM